MDARVRSLLYREPRLYDVAFPARPSATADADTDLARAGPEVEGYAEYRLLFPDELRALVEVAGFEVRALHDNCELLDSDRAGTASAGPDLAGMRGRKLFLFASASRR